LYIHSFIGPIIGLVSQVIDLTPIKLKMDLPVHVLIH